MCRTETFLPAFYVDRILELSAGFAELLPKTSGGQLKTASGIATQLSGRAKRPNRNPNWGIPHVVCLFIIRWSDKTVAEGEAKIINGHLTWMNNGSICPRTCSKHGPLTRLIWRGLMDWYLNFNGGQYKFRTDVQVVVVVVLLYLYLT
jgi:hypothetical protein